MATTPTAPTVAPAAGSTSGSLSAWAAPYITGYLGKAQALADTPYQMYQGPLTAGSSPLQNQAFQGIGGLTVPGAIGQAVNQAGQNSTYNPVGSNFNAQYAQQYMNPYLQTALNPQLEELRRQSQINQVGNDSRMTKAGAFGGSRQALMTTENQRNLMSQMDRTLGQGYADAYDKAAQQFNTDQQRKIQEAQFGADFGLKGAQTLGQLGQSQLGAQRDILRDQMAAGEVQRGIESEGIAADYGEFNTQREFPYKQLEFQRDMLSGLPASAVASQVSANPGGIAQLLSAIAGANALSGSGDSSISQLLNNLGLGGLFGSNS